MAKLYFTYGAMNSGKSTLILQVAHNYEERGMTVLTLKPKTDTKGNDRIVSRLGVTRTIDKYIDEDEDIGFYLRGRRGIACVLVDEAQFITPSQAEQLHEYAHTKDVPVMCYGLRTNFMGNGFPGASRLLELADKITEMKTICSCGRKATMNLRLLDGHPIFDGKSVQIDGSDERIAYLPVCADCYYRVRASK